MYSAAVAPRPPPHRHHHPLSASESPLQQSISLPHSQIVARRSEQQQVNLPLAILTARNTLPQFAMTAATASVPSLSVANFSSNCCIWPARPALKSRNWRRDSSSLFFSWMRAWRAEDWEFCEPPRPRPEEGRMVVCRGAKDIV